MDGVRVVQYDVDGDELRSAPLLQVAVVENVVNSGPLGRSSLSATLCAKAPN